MNRKKMLPLVLLAAGAVLLGVLLAVLTCENEAEEDTGIPLVDFAARGCGRAGHTPATMWM